MSEKKYFGTDGIRGRVGQGVISADFMLRLGRAAAAVLSGQGDGSVLIGKDTRLSGYMFESALEAGLIAGGVKVRLLGPMPTPAIAYLTRASNASAGVVISASHNPHYDNGIKFFSSKGEKLDDALELAIEAAIDAPFSTVEAAQLGKASRMSDAIERYIAFAKSTVQPSFSLRGMKIALDCAHGATYQIAPRVLRELGAEVISIGVSPDGLNINYDVGSTHPEALQRLVVDEKCHLGIGFDGDGDRLVFVDHLGGLIDGDAILYLLAHNWFASGRLRGAVVGTLMSNFGLQQSIEQLGVKFIRAKVGDRYVHQELLKYNGVLGGEASGHILCLDKTTTGDGLITALQVLEALTMQGQNINLVEALANFFRYPQKTVNVRCASPKLVVEHASVKKMRCDIEAELAGKGRVVLRPSGTEPVVRVTIEAADKALVEKLVAQLAEAVQFAN